MPSDRASWPSSVLHELLRPTLRTTQDAAADELLGRVPLAPLLGMLFDQHARRRSSRAPARAPLCLKVIESGTGSTARSARRAT